MKTRQELNQKEGNEKKEEERSVLQMRADSLSTLPSKSKSPRRKSYAKLIKSMLRIPNVALVSLGVLFLARMGLFGSFIRSVARIISGFLYGPVLSILIGSMTAVFVGWIASKIIMGAISQWKSGIQLSEKDKDLSGAFREGDVSLFFSRLFARTSEALVKMALFVTGGKKLVPAPVEMQDVLGQEPEQSPTGENGEPLISRSGLSIALMAIQNNDSDDEEVGLRIPDSADKTSYTRLFLTPVTEGQKEKIESSSDSSNVSPTSCA